MSQKNTQLQLDGTDKEILRKLMKDARTPILEIARKIGISGAAIHQRLRKLEQSGLITGSLNKLTFFVSTTSITTLNAPVWRW